MWISTAIVIMVIGFVADVMLTKECEHDWEEKGDGILNCTKCKKKTRERSYQRYNSNR